MRVAVVNETSAVDRNADIRAALDGRGLEVLNAGMSRRGETPELLYIHTGLIAALLLNLDVVDFVVGGCGTGQGFLNAVMQYPGVFCGYIATPLDAWLFARINAGNCISLPLNQGYGWAGEVNLRLIFDSLFTAERGLGYPAQRREPQQQARSLLHEVSAASHRSLAEIVQKIPHNVIQPVLAHPPMMDLIDVTRVDDPALREAFRRRVTDG